MVEMFQSLEKEAGELLQEVVGDIEEPEATKEVINKCKEKVNEILLKVKDFIKSDESIEWFFPTDCLTGTIPSEIEKFRGIVEFLEIKLSFALVELDTLLKIKKIEKNILILRKGKRKERLSSMLDRIKKDKEILKQSLEKWEKSYKEIKTLKNNKWLFKRPNLAKAQSFLIHSNLKYKEMERIYRNMILSL